MSYIRRTYQTRSTASHLLSLAGLLALTGCDGLYGPNYGGPPLMQFRAQVQGRTGEAIEDDTEVVIFWSSCGRQKCGHRMGGGFAFGGNFDDACFGLPECADYRENANPDEIVSDVEMACPELWECVAKRGGNISFGIHHYLNEFKGGFSSYPVAVTGTFPGAFVIDVYELPDESAERWKLAPFGLFETEHDSAGIALGVIVAKGPGQIGFSSKTGFRGDIRGGSQSHVVLYTRDRIARASNTGLMLSLDRDLEPGFHIMTWQRIDCTDPDREMIGQGRDNCGSWIELAPDDLETVLELSMNDPDDLSWPLTQHPNDWLGD